MDQLGVKRYCCRRMIMTHVDLIEKLLKYVTTRRISLTVISCQYGWMATHGRRADNLQIHSRRTQREEEPTAPKPIEKLGLERRYNKGYIARRCGFRALEWGQQVDARGVLYKNTLRLERDD